MRNTILVIEDNHLDLKNIHTILELSNYNVLTAENGISGVEKAKTIKPDLIICDIMMPELDGYSVLHMLGKDPETSNIPFIFLSSKGKKSDFRLGMNQGADDYITKPFEDMDLLNTIEKRISKSRNNKHLPSKPDFFPCDPSKGLNELTSLSETKRIKVLKKKENLFLSLDYPNWIYYLIKGKVKTTILNMNGKELITGLYKTGDFIGYSSLLFEKEYGYIATAIENCEVLKIPKEEFLTFLKKHPEVVQIFITKLAETIIEKENSMLNMAYNSVRKRIADALLEIYHKYKNTEEKKLTISILRHDLASMVGTSKETVTRTLSEFKKDLVIEINGSELTFSNYEGLKKIRW